MGGYFVAMTLDEVRTALGRQAPPSAAALREAVRQAAALAPDLIGLVERAERGRMLLPWDEQLLFFGLLAVAQAGERTAWPALPGLLDMPEWQLTRLFGADYSGLLGRLTLSLYDGDADPLYAALENDNTDPRIRWVLFELLARLAWEGRTDRDRLLAMIDRFDAADMAPLGDAAWWGWQNAIGLLGLRDRAARVRESWDNGRLPLTGEANQAAWLDLLAEAEASPGDPARFDTRRITPLTDATVFLHDGEPRIDQPGPADADPAAPDPAAPDPAAPDPATGVRLTRRELDWLADLLGSDAFLEDAMSLSRLDGFLTALVIGPEPVSPAEYLPVIWGGLAADEMFDDPAQAEYVLGLLMRHWNSIALRVERDYPVAPLIEADYAADDAAEWAEGFLRALAMRERAWMKLIRDRQGSTLIKLIVCLVVQPEGDDEEEQDDGDGALSPDMLNSVVDRLPDIVAGIAEYWRVHKVAPVPKGPAKVGRNDPCPCGSGRKFKLCCGGPGRVLS